MIRGPLRGPCAICGSIEDLTVDHVPSKGATRIAAMEVRSLTDRLSIDRVHGRFELSQNGVKFRSLCKRCNNVRLGAECDPELVLLCTRADNILRSPLALPPRFTVDVRPARVLRAVVGHLLATEPTRRPVGPFEEGLAEFFLDTKLSPPHQLECFYWLYPFNDQVILRDVGMTRLGRGLSPLIFKLLKFYPLSFMLTWERNEQDWVFSVPELARFHSHLSYDAIAPVLIDLRTLPHQRWPEAPASDGALLIGGQPLHASPRVQNRRSKAKQPT